MMTFENVKQKECQQKTKHYEMSLILTMRDGDCLFEV